LQLPIINLQLQRYVVRVFGTASFPDQGHPMPIGSYAAVPLLAQTLIQRQPKSVLDLGLGFGGCGVIVREWLDLGVRPWKTQLIGVEAFADYRNPVWDLYDVIYTQTIEEFLAACRETYDCILLGDVLEHFEKPAGQKLLEQIKPLVSKGGALLLTTPAAFFTQGPVYGNPLEQHRSLWTEKDLKQLGFHVHLTGQPHYYCGQCLFAEWQRK
jgi:hypothetical protein